LFDIVGFFLGFKNKEFWFVGSLRDGLTVRERRSK
jgi:hypothetical protein